MTVLTGACLACMSANALLYGKDTDLLLSRLYVAFFSAIFMWPALYVLPMLFKSVNTLRSATSIPRTGMTAHVLVESFDVY